MFPIDLVGSNQDGGVVRELCHWGPQRLPETPSRVWKTVYCDRPRRGLGGIEPSD